MLGKIKHNLPIKILSVIIAVLFWFMVYTNENPIESRNITIPLTPINEEFLASDNLKILNEYETTADITIRGRQTEIDKVSASDFTAYLDFSSITSEDTEYINITDFDYLGDRNITYDFAGSGRIGLSVDREVTGEIPITVEIIGETAEGFFVAGRPILKPANFAFLDIMSLVTQLETAVVTVDVSGMKGTETVRKFCMVYDANGELISELSNKTAVDITINIAKSVPVEVKTEGLPLTDFISADKTVNPSHVLVSGSEEDLLTIEKVSTLPVNIEGVSESFSVVTSLQTLPAGLGYVDSGEVEVSVAFEKLQQKIIKFNASQIDIRYGLANKKYDILSGSIELVVKGKQSQLDVTNSATISAYIDVSNTADGAYPLPVRFQNLDGVEQISFPLVDLHIRTTKSITVFTDDIFIDNREGGKYNYEFVNTSGTLKLIGNSELIELIEIESLNPIVDVSGYEAGTHSIPVQITLPNGVDVSGSFTVNLRITGK